MTKMFSVKLYTEVKYEEKLNANNKLRYLLWICRVESIAICSDSEFKKHYYDNKYFTVLFDYSVEDYNS